MSTTSRNVIPGWTPEQTVARARSMKGQGTYSGGKGGRNPDAPTPFDAAGRVDCSRFVDWCFGLDVFQDEAGWLDTDGIIKRAKSKDWPEILRIVEVPEVGDCLVYGDWRDDKGAIRQGHAAIVVESTPRWGRWGEVKIIHASTSNMRDFQHVVAQTAATVFASHLTYVIRRVG